MSTSVLRLLSLAKSSLTENSGDFVAGTHPDTNPEHSRGIFSGLLAGEKALPDKWAVGMCMYICVCMFISLCVFVCICACNTISSHSLLEEFDIFALNLGSVLNITI